MKLHLLIVSTNNCTQTFEELTFLDTNESFEEARSQWEPQIVPLVTEKHFLALPDVGPSTSGECMLRKVFGPTLFLKW